MPPLPAFDVLGFGAVAVDDLLYVDEYPAAESKVHVRRRLRQCGGLTGTALVAAARLGCRCAYVGVLGDDELSRCVAEGFDNEGIDWTYCAKRADARPAYSTIIVDQTHKTRTIFCSIEALLGADPARPEAALIRRARTLLVDHHGLEGTVRAARIARQSGIGVVADLERNSGSGFDELLALVDHLVISARFAQDLTGRDDPARAVKELATPSDRAVVVTCGADGCWYLDGGTSKTPQHCPAFPVDVVDTTGCGDVFHGAYAAALARGEDLNGRVVFASATAALKATHHGGQAGCPSRQEVSRFLAERGFHPGRPGADGGTV